MNKALTGVLLAIVLSLAGVSFAEFGLSAGFSAEKATIKQGESATIELSVISSTSDVYILTILGELPWMTLPSHATIDAFETLESKLYFQPYEDTKPGVYTLEFIFESFFTGERKAIPIEITIIPSKVTVEKVEFSTPPEAASSTSLEMLVKNFENKPLAVTLETEVSSNTAGTLYKSVEILSLAPNQLLPISRSFIVPECQPAGTYFTRTVITKSGFVIFEQVSSWQLPETFKARQYSDDGSFLLRSGKQVAVRNVGNIPGTALVTEDLEGSLFYSGDKPTETSDGIYSWSLPVEPCKMRVVNFAVDYSPLAIVILLAFGGWYGFHNLRTMNLGKSILQKVAVEKGNHFTIGLHVKSFRNVSNVIVRDFVPHVFDVTEVHSHGVKPITKRTPAGTEIIWKIKELARHEERVLAYKVAPLFGVGGKVGLPGARVSFMHMGKQMRKSSNKAALGIEAAAEQAEGGFLNSLASSVRGALPF